MDILTVILNAVLSQNSFSSDWKQAEVVMISKPRKDLQLPSSYRPINLLSNLSKKAEAIIFDDEAHLLPDDQFGFRQGLSTEFQLLRLTDEVRNYPALRVW